MTNETKKRIRYYKRALPAMREKVVAALMMLLIAATTVAASTYAWLTISASPEVTSVDTTVAANGALEIALANGTGAAPGKSREGDSTGAGTPITAANITWGNLVNLTDPSYGLANVTLRPAALNGTSGLLSNPLYGVGYGEDGRVDQMVIGDDFAYTYYDSSAAGTGGGRFMVDLKGEHLGVRAISTVQFENLEGAEQLNELLTWTNQRHALAKSNFQKITNETAEPGKSYITSLQGLIQTYAQNVIDKKPTSQLDITSYVENLYQMMLDMNDNVMEPTGEAYVGMANLLDLMKETSGGNKYSRDKAGVDALLADYRANKLPDYTGTSIASLGTFAADCRQLETYLRTGKNEDFSDLTDAQKKSSLAYWAYHAKNGGTVYWSDLSSIINWICDINSATLDGYTLSGLSNMSTAMKVIQNKTHSAVLNKGAIWRIEKRIGASMSPRITVTVDPSGLGGVAAMAGTQTFKDVPVTTSASDPREITTDLNAVKAQNSGSFRGDKATAQDTYALAIDLWLRTNAGADSTAQSTQVTSADGKTITTTDPLRAYLTLEGKVRYQEIEEPATVKAPDGNEYEAFTASGSVGGQKIEMTVYQKNDGKYYYLGEDDTEKEFSYPDVSYTPKMETRTVVSGYDGVNRVWSDEQMAPYEGDGTSTTQGGGSCYTFYASTPADQSRFLKLLGSMRVAFIDGQGNLIGAATMDTEHFYAENGKVTVPLALDTSSAIDLGDDGNGNTTYALMPLTKNAATRVTAIVYLDGEKLTNQMVLAGGDIQGNLNVQFGACVASKVSTVEDNGDGTADVDVRYERDSDNESIEHEDLMDDRIQITASANPTEFDYDPNNAAKTALSVKVAGVTPQKVEVCFVRAISATQGVQQERIALSGSGENWQQTVSFDKPGNYVLRTVWVDGVEYDLNQEPITVTVTGSSVNSLTCDALPQGSNSVSIMTADTSFSTNMTLGFTSSNQMPSRVNGIFMDKSGRQVNVPFTLESSIWKGKATFTTSGTYTMQYVEIDGETYELNENLQPTLILTLGIKAEVRISAADETLQKLQSVMETAMPTRFVYDRSKLGDMVTLRVDLKLYDNSGNEIKAQSGVKLYYGRVGSMQEGLDADLAWTAASGSYVGNFGVNRAGTFRFTKVTVDLSGATSTITAKTTAPDIQVMPPEDAYYFGNYTETYQYVPSKDGVLTVGIAYSNAATKVEALLSDGKATVTVEGKMGGEAADQGDKSVNLWSFAVPNEGNWKLTSVKMYGVYYAGQYYDENGISVDLTKENIHAKIVKILYVTLAGNSQNFTGYFMDDHTVNDMTVTIEDFEGMAIEGTEVSDVKLSYSLDLTKIGIESEYKYETDDMSSVILSGTGTQKSGTTTEYAISGINFQQAGPYALVAVQFKLGDTPMTATKASDANGVKLQFKDGGTSADSAPKYDVKWVSPTVRITAVSPAPSVKINVNIAGGTTINFVQTSNYFEDYYAYLGFESSKSWLPIVGNYPSYTAPKATFQLTSGGNRYSSAKIYLTYTEDKEEKTANTISFNGDKAVNSDVGLLDGYTRRSINETKKAIEMTYNNKTYNVALSHELTITTSNNPKPRLEYVDAQGYEGKIKLPEGVYREDGRVENITLAKPTETFTVTEEKVGEKTYTGKTTETSNVYYTTSDGCDTTYHPYTKTVTTETYSAKRETTRIEYKVGSWKLQSAVYTGDSGTNIESWKDVSTRAVGSTFTLSRNYYRATPIFSAVKTEVISSADGTYAVITTTYAAAGDATTTKPSNSTELDKNVILDGNGNPRTTEEYKWLS